MGSTSPWIDDRDKRVRFDGVWIVGGSPKEYLETVSSSTRVGDSFVVPFYGMSIVVYGTIDSTSGGVVTNYSIDGRPAEQVTSQSGTGDTFHQQFWASQALNVTQHELTVTMAKINPAEPGEGTIWFDYFVVNDPSGHEALPPKKVPKGAIAGGVVGGVILLACIIILAILCLRRRKRRKEEKLQEEHQRFREFGYPGYDKGIREDRDLIEERARASWVHAQQQRQSRNGIQPFVLGISVPQDSHGPSDSVSPPRPTWPRDRKGHGITATSSSNNPQMSESSRISTSLGVSARPSSSVGHRGNASTPFELESRSPLSPSDIDESLSSSAGTSSGAADRSIPKLDRINSQRRKFGHRTVASSLGPSSNDTNSVRAPEGDGTGQASGGGAVVITANESRGRNSREGSIGGDSRPVIRVVTGVNGEGDSDNQGVAPLQHIDSGVRLAVEEVRLPAELPPVYSPT